MSGYPPCAICGEMPAASVHALTPQPLEAGTRFAVAGQHNYEHARWWVAGIHGRIELYGWWGDGVHSRYLERGEGVER